MRVTFWGVRGSIPAPGPDTVRYGGNTPCIEVLTEEGDIIVLDAGSGIRVLGNSLANRKAVSCSIFISHTHWDHIQGLPFFGPLLQPGGSVRIFGSFDPVERRPLKDILDRQLDYCFFPIRTQELKAHIEYTSLACSDSVRIGSTTVRNAVFQHTVLNYGYRITSNGKSLSYTGDYEPHFNIYGDADPAKGEFEELIRMQEQTLEEFLMGTDVLVADSQYTPEEYPSRKGWGHGTWLTSCRLALRVGAKKLVLFHHDPMRKDDDLDDLCRSARHWVDSQGSGGLHVSVAREGTVLEL